MTQAHTFDVLILGTGIAGLSSGIKLAEQGLKIALITREVDPKISNTFWAQGGIIYPQGQDDELKDDIQNASSGTSYNLAAETIVKNSGRIVEELLLDKVKVPFERSDEGKLKLTMEAAHSKARILYKGDFTGKEIEVGLLNYLNNKDKFPNVTFFTGHTAIDLLTPLHHGVELKQRYENNRVLGAYVFSQQEEKVQKILAKITILATGGIGALYLHHSNADGARGDGHAMAKRAGAILTNMEFVQFHPTTFFDRSAHRRFLISEALRGEGGILLNCEGKRFMEKYDAQMELASRDVVARSIDSEMIETHHECVYLDISHKPEDWIKKRFPTIYEHCLDKKIDITKMPIPVVPAAHYSCGGVKTDLKGRTNLPGLYAVGEVACTGLHGANRLASTSLLEGLTWGYLAAEDIQQNIKNFDHYKASLIKNWKDGVSLADPALIHQDWITVKQTMWNYVGLTRSSNRLARANAMFSELYDEVERFYKNTRLSDDLIGLRNAIEVAQSVVKASVQNKESIGSFYRIN